MERQRQERGGTAVEFIRRRLPGAIVSHKRQPRRRLSRFRRIGIASPQRSKCLLAVVYPILSCLAVRQTELSGRSRRILRGERDSPEQWVDGMRTLPCSVPSLS